MSCGDPRDFADYLQQQQNRNLFGPTIVFSGLMSIQLRSLGGYQSQMVAGSSSNTAGDYIDDNVYIGDPMPAWGQPWTQPQITQPILPSIQPGVPCLTHLPVATPYKNCFYNREAFLEFVENCRGKVMVFMDMTEEKVVEKAEALKLVFFHYLGGKRYRQWDDFKYQDDEWCIFFRTATKPEELLEEFDFTYEQIKGILCM